LLENSRPGYWAACIWALTGAVILIGDALSLRRRRGSAHELRLLSPAGCLERAWLSRAAHV